MCMCRRVQQRVHVRLRVCLYVWMVAATARTEIVDIARRGVRILRPPLW